MKKTTLYSLLASLFILITACRKDQDIIEITKDRPIPTTIVETVVKGMVTDRNGQVLENVQITLDQNTFYTDINGYFLANGDASSIHALLRVEKDGYFHTVHTVTPSEQDTVTATIQLIERNNPTIIEASKGGTVSIDNSATVDFQANSFVDEQGNPYTGNVYVYGHFLDPTDSGIDRYMPGDMTAINAEEDLQVLLSYGMVNVELEGDNGMPVQINQAATLNISVPPGLQSAAPSEIPLWYFDETDGFWKEEGSATLENGVYVGTVEHFSFWNCDVPADLAFIDGTVTTGELAPTVRVCLTRPDGNLRPEEGQRCANTSAQGIFSGAVPINEVFTIEIYDLCDNLLYTGTIGPFTEDTSLDPIVIPFDDAFTMVSGTVEDCNQNPVSNGYAVVNVFNDGGTYIYPLNNNGGFFGLVSTCGETDLDVFAGDLDQGIYGDPTTVTITNPLTNVGTILACGNQIVAEVTFEYNGTTYTIDNCTIDSDGSGGIYEFTAADSQVNGNKLIYRFTFIDWNMDPTNPLLAATYEHTLINNPDPYFGFDGGTIVPEVIGTQPGEFIIFEVNDATIIEYPSMTQYAGGKVRISGMLQ